MIMKYNESKFTLTPLDGSEISRYLKPVSNLLYFTYYRAIGRKLFTEDDGCVLYYL